MKYIITVVKDEILGFGAPTLSDSDSAAYRDFSFTCSKDNMLHFKPENFSLVKIGTFDSSTGAIEVSDPIEIVKATEVV